MVGEVRNGAKKFTRIPAKWRDFSVCGKVIAGERLVSFKTPLSEEYHCHENERYPDDCLQKDEQFTPNDLCKIFKKRGHILGLVVDFTNTKRYYQPQEFTKHGIEYKKIKCEGKIVPPEKVVHKFKATLLSFFKKFPNTASIVGIHCTHGLNRAGYIVCRYLIECRGYSPEEAIEVFNEARGHKMERENYLEDLQQRKPEILSEQDVERLIETSPSSDDERQPDEYRKNDYRDRNQQRRDTHAPFRSEIPEPRRPTGGERRYRKRFRDRHVERQDYWDYDEVCYDDDRVYSRRFTDDTGRYQINERGDNMFEYDDNYQRDSYTDQDRFPNRDERQKYETNLCYDSRFDSYPEYNDRYRGGERRHGVDHRRRIDHRNGGRYHHSHYDRRHEYYEEPTNYRERDDRDNSRMHNRNPRRDYRWRQEHWNNEEH